MNWLRNNLKNYYHFIAAFGIVGIAFVAFNFKQILISNTDPIQTDKPIGGRLNAFKAVCDPLVLNCPIIPPQPSNTWQSVGPMAVERAEHTSTLLNYDIMTI